MNTKNIGRTYAYLNDFSMSSLQGKKAGAARKASSRQAVEGKDTLDISKSLQRASKARRAGFGVDKGTAAHTTLYVDRGTFDQIANYTTFNPECKWDEIGVDGEKRWVVVNGQRFECPLSEEEKKAARRFAENSNLMNVITKAEKKRDEERRKHHLDGSNSVKMTVGANGKIDFQGTNNFPGNTKLQNLAKNEKVMNMLSHIAAANGGMRLGVF